MGKEQELLDFMLDAYINTKIKNSPLNMPEHYEEWEAKVRANFTPGNRKMLRDGTQYLVGDHGNWINVSADMAN